MRISQDSQCLKGGTDHSISEINTECARLGDPEHGLSEKANRLSEKIAEIASNTDHVKISIVASQPREATVLLIAYLGSVRHPIENDDDDLTTVFLKHAEMLESSRLQSEYIRQHLLQSIRLLDTLSGK